MIFAILTLLSALTLAGVAGWFSIVGIMSIYAGAPLHAALVMGIVLELAKLVTTSWLYRNWEFADWKLKLPLIYFTIALMLATSIGVFGFLTKSHLEQGAATVDNTAKVERLDQQITREKSIIADNEKVIGQLDATINSFIGKDRADRAVVIRKTQAPQRKQLRDDIDVSQKKIDVYSDEKFKLTSEVRALNLEVGPIRYIAELFYSDSDNVDETKKIESAVKIFTLLIVSTLDPLAVILLIAANHTILRRQNEEKENKSQDKVPETEAIPDVDADNEEGNKRGVDSFKQVHKSDEQASIPHISETKLETVPISIPQVNEEADGEINETKEALEEIVQTECIPEGEIQQIQSEEVVWADTTIWTPDKTQIEEIKDETEDTVLEIVQPNEEPLPIIRSPGVTRISFAAATEPKENTKVENTVLANIDALREIVGSGPHFIPQKINDQEKVQKESNKDNTSSSNENVPSPPIKKEVQEMVESFQNKVKETNGNEGTTQSAMASTNSHATNKYPKALSWLTEFKGE
jgi:hypothetical protein